MPCTRHRVFLATLICAAKNLNDSSPKNKHWAKYAQMFSQAEVNLMEKQLLYLLDYDLSITEDELCHYASPFLDQYGYEEEIATPTSIVSSPCLPVTPRLPNGQVLEGPAKAGTVAVPTIPSTTECYNVRPYSLDRSSSASSLSSRLDGPMTPLSISPMTSEAYTRVNALRGARVAHSHSEPVIVSASSSPYVAADMKTREGTAESRDSLVSRLFSRRPLPAA